MNNDPLKYWEEKQGKDNNGLTELELDPPLEVLDSEELTLDVVTRLCACLQVDADKVLFSNERIELPDHPPLTHIQEFFDILVKNSDEYNIEEMPASQVKMLVAGLTSYFIQASQKK